MLILLKEGQIMNLQVKRQKFTVVFLTLGQVAFRRRDLLLLHMASSASELLAAHRRPHPFFWGGFGFFRFLWRVRDDDFLVGCGRMWSDCRRMCSNRLSIGGSIQRVTAEIWSFQISWQAHYLVRLQGDFTCSTHWK